MARVRLSSHTNSTLFTTCCGVAISNDDDACPRCGEEVFPISARERWDYAMLRFYGADKLKEMRASYKRGD